jgi:hypothetical protein
LSSSSASICASVTLASQTDFLHRHDAASQARARREDAVIAHLVGPRRWNQMAPDGRVFERDGGRCTVPGCTSYRNLHSHHSRFRSANGPDDPWNRTMFCAAHHHRCVHEGIGRIRIRGCAPDALRFELPLATYR